MNRPNGPGVGLPVRLSDTARLRCLRETGLLDGADCASLDRLARAAAQQLRATGALVSLIGADRRVVAGHAGPVPARSFCRLVVDLDAPLVLCDARADELLGGHPAIDDGLLAYAGFPVRSPDGYPLGAFGVLDSRPREWEPRDLLLVEYLAAAVESEQALRASVRHLQERLATLS